MGLDLSPDLCLANMRQILRRAKDDRHTGHHRYGGFAHTQVTLKFSKPCAKNSIMSASCLQSYLYRSEEDMQMLYALGAEVRLCKGAYKEPADLAFPRKKSGCELPKLAQIFFQANGNARRVSRTGDARRKNYPVGESIHDAEQN